jgi:hypothetical protein
MLILGFASARKGNITMSQMQESSNIGELEVAAVAASVKDDHDYAIKLMTKAVELEDKLGPPSGPPSLVKPPHELFGELLLRAGKPAEAAEQFRASLLRQTESRAIIVRLCAGGSKEWGPRFGGSRLFTISGAVVTGRSRSAGVERS